MATSKNGRSSRRPPAKTPEEQEARMISLAISLAEKQLEEGTASTAVISHYLKLGSQREKLEREKLMGENKLLKAKTESLESQARAEELVEKALHAMRTYKGESDVDPDLL